MFKALRHIIVFFVLTILTQVGGIIYLLCLGIAKRLLKKENRLKHTISFTFLFVATYLIFTFAAIPQIAKLSGRVPLTTFSQEGNIRPLNKLTFFLNRHYVTKELKQVLSSIEKRFHNKYPNTIIHYLDANFPFFDGFPLIPHLSHNDGEKLDLAFFYIDTSNVNNFNDNPSYMGYGTYVEPLTNEINTTLRCKEQGYWQYALTGKIFPSKRNTNLVFDKQRTKILIQIITKENDMVKFLLSLI